MMTPSTWDLRKVGGDATLSTFSAARAGAMSVELGKIAWSNYQVSGWG